MPINRRFVLKSLGFGATAWVLSPATGVQPVQANPEKPENFFIFCYFSGGWDTLISLDPRDPGVFNESRIRETKIELGYDRLQGDFKPTLYQPPGSKIAFGPVMEPFAKHFDVSCVVRGISMDTVSHNVGRRYFITGMMPRGQNAVGSSISTWLVAGQGEQTAIPNLVVGVESYNRKSPAFASGLRVSGVTDLLSTLKDGPESPKGKIREIIDEYRALNEHCDPAALNEDGLMSLIHSSQKSARVLVSQDLGRFFNFYSRDKEMQDIRKRYAIRSLGSGGAQAAMAYQAIKSGIAQSITIHLAGGLDTHGTNWETNQPRNLYNGFKALSTLVDDLKRTPHPSLEGKKLIDTTTIMCFSEFSRTPLLNNNGGRDHWLASSALLIGAGVPHNKVIGATTDKGFNPSAINPQTGEPDSSGTLITPTRIAASLVESAGYSSDHFRVGGLPCLKV